MNYKYRKFSPKLKQLKKYLESFFFKRNYVKWLSFFFSEYFNTYFNQKRNVNRFDSRRLFTELYYIKKRLNFETQLQ